HLRISSDKAIFPPLASHNFGSRPHGQKNNAGISALQGSGPLPLLPALSLLFCICCGKIPYTFRPLLITWLSMRWSICFSVPFTLCKAAFPESGMGIFLKAVFTTQLF
ncbi:hypothetical protein, partial [Enterocloster clostridioformis]|uniref:hypothetical protein n=1 Tax=Enterocloster clostridioformis TaxID=1531 RepID=UPI001F219D6E